MLALYYRIFVALKFRIVVLTTAVFVILWLMTMEILLGLQCRPISRFWDSDVPGKCLNLVEFTYFTNVINLVTDIWIFSLPLPVICKLQMSRNRKIALSFLFSIGLALVLPITLFKFARSELTLCRTCAISATRLSVVITQGSSDFTCMSAYYQFSITLRPSNDAGDGVPLGILSAWEPLGGIFCANLPIIYRALVTMLRNLKGSVSGPHSRTGDPSSQSYRDAEQSHRPWARLYNGSGPQVDYHSEASATKARGEVTELRSINGNAIQVDQYFEQQVYHEGEENPLCPVPKGSS